MTDENSEAVAWNEEARISCAFAFKCPKTWNRLTPTANSGIRYCSECNREVHLALTEEDFRRHAEGKRCVAVKVLTPDTAEPAYLVGSLATPYGAHLKRV